MSYDTWTTPAYDPADGYTEDVVFEGTKDSVKVTVFECHNKWGDTYHRTELDGVPTALGADGEKGEAHAIAAARALV